MNVFIVIPAFNEHAVIKKVVNDLHQYNYKMVVVDDGSEVSLHPLLDGKAILLRHSINLGQGAALQTGIEFALQNGADYIITFDADGQHSENDIPVLLNVLQENNLDIVLGSRFLPGSSHNMSTGRRILITIARYINYFVTGILLSDAHNGIRAMTKEAAAKMQITQNRMAHATEIVSIIRKHRLRFKEVPVAVTYTDYSLQKGQKLQSGFRIFFDILLKKLFQ